jgi:putative ABC transport system permease protein
MSWIALKMLLGDRAKFYGIVMGLTFAALLITQQGSIFCGLMCRTAGQIYDIGGADLWVMDANVRYVDDVKPMIENNLYRVRGVEGVRWAVPLFKGIARAKLSSVGSLADLRQPDAVMVDFTRLTKLYPGEDWSLLKSPGLRERAGVFASRLAGRGDTTPQALDRRTFYQRFVGRELEMNDHRAVIVGVCEATPTFQSNAVMYTTYSRAKRFIPQERKILSYVLAQTEPGHTPADVAAAIARQTGLKARTSHEFIWDTIMYYLKYTGIPINFGITTLLGFLVGTAIAGQTFYNFTIENLKQFGALKAMGATNRRIVAMIVLQAAVVGMLGYGMGVGLAALFGLVTAGSELAYYTPGLLLPLTAAAVVLICILSSLLSVRRVIVLEPAVVFRG